MKRGGLATPFFVSEVLRDGLRLVQAREETQAAKLAALREAVAVGIADVEAGRYTDFHDADSLRNHIQGIRQRVSTRGA
jgi:antitoxin ParD1/3/4